VKLSAATFTRAIFGSLVTTAREPDFAITYEGEWVTVVRTKDKVTRLVPLSSVIEAEPARDQSPKVPGGAGGSSTLRGPEGVSRKKRT
jgi:hypothetical protein